MDKAKIKMHLPTLSHYLEKRRVAKTNQLPKHLRPPEIRPVWIQIFLNSALIVTLCNLMVDRDDFMSEAGPAITLVICLLLLIYTLITALRMRHTYDKTRGQKLAKLNVGLMILAFLLWAASIVVFLS
jgi:hypothetical protein